MLNIGRLFSYQQQPQLGGCGLSVEIENSLFFTNNNEYLEEPGKTHFICPLYILYYIGIISTIKHIQSVMVHRVRLSTSYSKREHIIQT